MEAVSTSDVDRPTFARAARALGRVALVGAVCGALIGGVGGRLAMFVLRLTSSPAVVGLTSDDGFTIGSFTAATAFLLGVTTFLGMVGAFLYTAGRGWVPRRWRQLVWGTLCGLFIGADLVSPEGIDFRLLTPQELAIVLFVAIPAAYGVVVSRWVDRVLEPGRDSRAGWLGYAPLAAFALLGPIGLASLGLLLTGCAVWGAIPVLGRIWASQVVTWAGRALIAVVAVTGLLELIDDVPRIV
jgi:hypothetical protein